MNKKDILDLIEIMNDNDLTGLKVDDGKNKIELERHSMLGKTSLPQMADRVRDLLKNETESTHNAAIEKTEEDDSIIVKCPMVGTFFVAPSPDESPFVKIGSEVLSGQTLGIVEAMKLMNEITAPKAGIISEIYAQNEDQVEYDQPLFKIKF